MTMDEMTMTAKDLRRLWRRSRGEEPERTTRHAIRLAMIDGLARGNQSAEKPFSVGWGTPR